MFGLMMFSKNCNKNHDLYSCEAHRWPLKPEKKTFSLKKKCIDPSAKPYRLYGCLFCFSECLMKRNTIHLFHLSLFHKFLCEFCATVL